MSERAYTRFPFEAVIERIVLNYYMFLVCKIGVNGISNPRWWITQTWVSKLSHHYYLFGAMPLSESTLVYYQFDSERINFIEIGIETKQYSCKKINRKVSSVKWWPCCLRLCVLMSGCKRLLGCWAGLVGERLVQPLNTKTPRQNGRHFADDTFKHIFFNENVRISIKISLKFVPTGPINNIPALVQIMAWRRPGDKPLSELITVRLPTHICVTRPQCVNDCEEVIQLKGIIYILDLLTCQARVKCQAED